MFRLLSRRLRPVSGPAGLLSARSARSFGGCPPELPAARVRSTFLDFFRQKHGHLLVPSSTVRPRGDPSLLFVNAGMNQFKPIFLGTVDPRSEMASYRRVVNSQKCVRAGGKHNDLEDVGRDVYHHTFFEMLGNWSFGDYFKEEACSMAWSLLTEHYGIPADRLYVSYFAGDAASGLKADEETRQIWLDIGVPYSRLLPFGLKENFWEMGDSGPCGPCTEIHYDHVGGRDAGTLVNADSPDVVEIWNLVFMQYNREVDTSLRLLPQFSVDTGMGLERLVTVLQGKRSNYDTDLFTPLLHAIHQRSKVGAYGGRTGAADQGKLDMAYRVVADHIRTLSVCIADGVHPGMSGAELVLRRILRRAVRFCVEVLQAPQGALASLVPTVTHILGDVYPELHREADRIMDIINENEAQFLSSLQQGSRLIHRTLNRMDYKHGVFPASVAWSLHRDLGFPLDLVDLMLEERGVQVDRQELDRLIAENQKVASDLQSGVQSQVMLDVLSLAELQRLGVPHTDDSLKYQYRLEQDRYVFPACHATVLALYDGEALVSEVTEGQRCGVVLDKTCFYSEQGGQSHDQGYFTRDGLQDLLYPVEEVVLAGGYVVHQVTAADSLKTGDQVQLHLDQVHRLSCMVKHTATHILNFALRTVLGPSVQQRGSHVSADRLRFDFSVKGSLSVSQLQQVERCVNNIISANQIVHSQELPLQRVRSIAGLRTVDEMYPDPVRVVSVAIPVSELLDDETDRQTSVELCCGTHLLQTGAIEDLVIVSERQMVKGISRIIAVTGQEATRARDAGQVLSQDVDSLSARLTGSPPSCLDSAQRLAKEVGVLSDAVDNTPIPQWQRRELQSRLKALQRTSNTTVRKMETREAAGRAQALLEKNGRKDLLVDSVETDSLSVVMKTVNQLSSISPLSHVMLLAHQGHSGKVLCACQVPKVLTSLSASDWAVAVCRHLGGSAGGSALVAKGTGSSSDIAEALKWAEEFARRKIQQ
ncbi:alanine--tRNA ligase, mitochondrial isoform X1 [Xiphias gladius]|uniref:alanine--tRNA ligase, mitochondrial isoform X1 n=1 Tax=Xiphias gladius TaxID=8245 RepID=UPI001A980924|nr:alanine--tRNA ligase, mitochondrial isoform X1 [Xiphias gladius]XP_040002496.1 alanine--tRNA ligase, mitochondrial isoform X1 [Xiphias gladius]XP_040002497.1 alanine--tRNA ligase, mitochondrial isoform X1 [Xiphias gladius]